MTSRDFVYWLQGYLEIASAGNKKAQLDADQLECVQKHLNLVFKHEIDPGFDDAEELQKIHNPEVKAKKVPKNRDDLDRLLGPGAGKRLMC